MFEIRRNNMSKVETLFNILDRSTQIVKQACNISYLESFVIVAEDLFEETISQEYISDSAIQQLIKNIEQFTSLEIDAESIRRAFQLAILKGMKDGVKATHEMTPDA